MNFESKVSEIKGVGEKTEKNLNKLGVFTIGQLLEHFPRNYDVYEPPVKICEIDESKKVAIMATLTKKPDVVNLRRLSVVTLEVFDGTGSVLLKWYNSAFLRNTLQVGQAYVFRGKPVIKGKKITIDQAEVLTLAEYHRKINFMQPIYPLTEGVSNNLLMKLIHTVLDELDLYKEYLDENLRRQYRLAEYNFAISQIHFPETKESLMHARKRLVFDEFYLFALAIQQMKENHQNAINNYKIENTSVCDQFVSNLPYPLTSAQLRTWADIKKDFCSEFSMNRLVQGDVGSGKTVIAQIALLAASVNGYQGCLMAPTEVLAKQHYETFTRDFDSLGIRVELLTGSMTAKEKRLAYDRIEKHEVDIVIGTHALIQEKVKYAALALVITDEQHRFGVKQREFLSEKGYHPHVLVMSATPIPRTLAIILYGDLDISVIDELPARRLPIKNCAVDTGYRPNAYRFIEKQIAMGHQAYVICPMVEESENAQGENVIDYCKKLQEVFPKDVVIEYLHGKQKPKEKNDIMERFASGEIKVLVSTTVVEVGVNVPNATVMMIEDAQRFGLAQLHQLRGRVGRGDAQSYCIFINTSKNPGATQRLEVLVKSNDGFFIAGEDLKLRGPGDLFGLKQSGLIDFKIGDLFHDMDMLKAAGDAAKDLLSKDPALENHPVLKEKLDLYMKHTLESIIL